MLGQLVSDDRGLEQLGGGVGVVYEETTRDATSW
jgi:hypothetical protein